MTVRIKPLRSNTPGVVPTLAQLQDGEIATNMADGKIFQRNGNAIVELGKGSGGGTTQTFTDPPMFTQARNVVSSQIATESIEQDDPSRIIEVMRALKLNAINVPVRVEVSKNGNNPVVNAATLAKAERYIKAIRAEDARIAITLEAYPWIDNGVSYEYEWAPTDQALAFANYRACLTQIAGLAAKYGAVAIYIGAALIPIEDNTAEWRATIQHVRSRFAGAIMYRIIKFTRISQAAVTANYFTQADKDRYDAEYNRILNLPWLADIDIIAFQAYFELTDKPNPTVSDLKAALRNVPLYGRGQDVFADVKAFADKWKKPILFGELGCGATVYGAFEPFNANAQQPAGATTPQGPSEAVQANLYQAYNEVFGAEPWYMGFSAWGSGYGGNFDPVGKQAEQTIAGFAGGSPRQMTRIITANYNATYDDSVLIANVSTSAGIWLQLPNSLRGQRITIRRVDSNAAWACTVVPQYGYTIEGQGTLSLDVGAWVTLVCDGKNWFTVARPSGAVTTTPAAPYLSDYVTPDAGLMYDSTSVGAATGRAAATTPWVGFDLGAGETDAMGELPRTYSYVSAWVSTFSGSKTFRALILDDQGKTLLQKDVTVTGTAGDQLIEFAFSHTSASARTLLLGGVNAADSALLLTGTDKSRWINGQPLLTGYTADASLTLTSVSRWPLATLGGAVTRTGVRGFVQPRQISAGLAAEGSVLKVVGGQVALVADEDPRRTFRYFEDFPNILNGTRFISTLATSGAVTYASPGGTQIGLISISAATTANSRAIISTQAAPPLSGGAASIVIEAELRVTVAADNASQFFGLSDSTTSTAPSNGVGLYNNGTGTWKLYGNAGGTATLADTGLTVTANQWITMRLELTTDGAVLYVGPSSGSLTNVATLAASTFSQTAFMNLTAGSMRSATAGTVAANLHIDWIDYAVRFATRRGAS